MASYDDRAGRRYDAPREPRYDTPRETRYDTPREARYVETRETRETYRPPAQGQELVPRTRNESEFSVEPYEQDRDIRHTRSDPYYDDYYDRYDNRAVERHRSRKGPEHSYEYSSHERTRRRVISKEQKIMAALAGAALFAGGKELYDRYEAKEDGTEVHRNPLASAALGAAGALAGYQGVEIYEKHGSKTSSKSKQLVRARDERGWDSDDSDSEYYHEKGNKNFIEKAIAAAGLGGALKAMNNHDNRSERSERDGRSERDSRSERSYRTRSRRDSRSSSRSSRRSEPGTQKVQQAAMASLLAGASEAFRVSKQPGGWKGEKAKRVLTAAISAGGINAAHDSSKHEKVNLMESVLGGLLANRAIRGSKKDIEEDYKTGRSRSRSRARSRSAHGGGASAIAGPLAAIAGAMAAKKAVGRSRSRSRGGRRDDSTDSRRSFRDRSRSAVRKGLSKIGIGNEPDHYEDEYHEEDRHHRRHRDHDEDDRSRSRSASRRDKRYESDSDSGNTDEDEKQYRKKRGKSIITTGLAAVATIHAMHGVAQGYEKRQQRQKAVKEGKVSPGQAKKLKGKALLQDATSIGFAALGITEAISELKEAKELNDERKHWKEEKRLRHERRLARQQQQRGAEYHPRRRADGYYTTSPVRSRRHDDGYNNYGY